MLDGTDCKVLLDMEATKSFMSKTFYLNSPLLHILPRFVWRIKNILVGNGQYEGGLFVSPTVIDLQEYRFEVYNLVSEVHDNVNIMNIRDQKS